MVYSRKRYHKLFIFLMVFTTCYIYRDVFKMETFRSHLIGQNTSTEDSVQTISSRPRPRLSQSQSDDVKVLLVTYYRGGSSFLGEAFNRNPDAFYWYEPLNPALLKLRLRMPKQYEFRTEQANMLHINGSVLEFPQDYLEEQTQNLVNILNCRLDLLHKDMFRKYIAIPIDISLTFTSLKKCLESKSRMHTNRKDVNYSDEAIEECLPDVIHSCQKSRVKAVKTIRATMSMIPRLLELDPDIKVVFSVRDPRASRVSMWIMWRKSFTMEEETKWAKMTCARMLEDHVMTSRLTAANASVLALRYEDLAADVNKTVADIYNFLGLQLPPVVEKWLYNSTHAPRSDGTMGTVRRDAVVTSKMWIHSINKVTEDAIMSVCENALRTFGYNTSERYAK